MRIKIKSIEKRGMGFILEQTNGKLKPVYANQLIAFERINSKHRFKRTQKPTAAGFTHLTMYNCNFDTNFYAVLKT